MRVIDRHVSGETIRIQWRSFKGRTYLDVRTYYTDDNGEAQPTKKGITISPEMLPELLEALTAIQQEQPR